MHVVRFNGKSGECEGCGRRFDRKTPNHRFCAPECSPAHRNRKSSGHKREFDADDVTRCRCGYPTTGGKPVCPMHLDELPYVRWLLAEIERLTAPGGPGLNAEPALVLPTESKVLPTESKASEHPGLARHPKEVA